MRRRSRLATGVVVVLGVMAGTAVIVGRRPLHAQRDGGPVGAPPLPTEAVSPPPAASPEKASAPAPTASIPLPTPESPGPPVAPEPRPQPGDPLPAQVPQPSPTAPPAAKKGDDPEQAANDYIARTRRDAEATAKALRAEAAALRERLKKVESALSRYEALLSALDPEGLRERPGGVGRLVPPPQGVASGVPTFPGTQHLDPIPASPLPDEPPLKPAPGNPPPDATGPGPTAGSNSTPLPPPQVVSEPKR